MPERASTRFRHGRLEGAACQVVVVLIFAIQLHGLQQSSTDHPVLADVEVAATLTEFESTPTPYPTAAIIEAGWLSLTVSLRLPTTGARAGSLDTSHADVAYARAFGAQRYGELLAVQTKLAAAKNGRHVARATTIPPPVA